MIKANLSQNGEVQDWRENDFKTVKHLTLQNMKNNRFPFEIKTIENDSFIIFQQFEYLKLQKKILILILYHPRRFVLL